MNENERELEPLLAEECEQCGEKQERRKGGVLYIFSRLRSSEVRLGQWPWCGCSMSAWAINCRVRKKKRHVFTYYEQA